MPWAGVSEEVSRVFAENLERFKSYLDKEKEITSDIDLLAEGEEGVDAEKVSSIAALNKLLNNYKMMVYNQQNVL
jgi:predicted nucleotidyltransferase